MERAEYALHRIKGYVTTLYLIEYEHGLLLLDCGTRGDAGRVAEYCERELKRSVQDIKLAVASHYHPDHGGRAHILRRQYGIPLAAHPDIDAWYRGCGGFIQHKLDTYMTQKLAKAMQLPTESLQYPRKIKPDYLLTDGSAVPFFEDWQVLWTPGHTACDITLYHPTSGLLCIFDLLNCVKKDHYQLPLLVLMHAEMVESFNKLAALPVEQVLVSHGPSGGMSLKSEDFLAMREKVWLPPVPLARYTYNRSWFNTYWRRYRHRLKASGQPVYPEKMIEWRSRRRHS